MSETLVGLIGLGNMGSALARRLLARGAVVHASDPNEQAAAAAQAFGAIMHDSPRAVADVAPVMIACLPTVAISTSVAMQAAGGEAVRYYIEMSTIGPQTAAELEALLNGRAVGFLDAAVSGGAEAALAGTLAIMVSGAPDARAATRPILERISEKLFVIGDRAGQAQSMKLINNLLAAANMANAFEALVLGVKFGLEPRTMVDVINAGSGRSMALVDRRVHAILNGRFDSGPKIALLHKDIGLALQEARAVGFPLADAPALSGAAMLWERAAQRGMRDEDVTALIRVVEEAAGVVVRSSE